VRQGLKKLSDWPTFPQLYVKGQLVGGLDVVKELAEEEDGLKGQTDVHDVITKILQLHEVLINNKQLYNTDVLRRSVPV
jgi:hypothetical protein